MCVCEVSYLTGTPCDDPVNGCNNFCFCPRNWKMRWFVLRDSKLMYFENDSEEKLKGTIDIRAAK